MDVVAAAEDGGNGVESGGGGEVGIFLMPSIRKCWVHFCHVGRGGRCAGRGVGAMRHLRSRSLLLLMARKSRRCILMLPITWTDRMAMGESEEERGVKLERGEKLVDGACPGSEARRSLVSWPSF